MTTTCADTFDFFRAWLRAPLRVASIVPSGQALAELITSELTAETGPVLELGPGSGVFTRAIINRGVRESDLVLVESGAEFATKLAFRFPAAHLLQMDAAALRSVEIPQGWPVGAVVSGLPLLSIPVKKVMAILEGAFAQMGADGAFYQFTYGPRCPVPRPILDRLGLKATLVGQTFANLPPARVYRIRRRPARLAPAW
ncbi:class I SAM-dependent methyltransferase [Azorhizobium oxalatiphilum]|nr:phospholipid methyltransferase [Azorhizobium oxalatiphilum]